MSLDLRNPPDSLYSPSLGGSAHPRAWCFSVFKMAKHVKPFLKIMKHHIFRDGNK